MIPGDGVGPEMMDSVQDVLKAIGAPIDFEVHHLSEAGTLQSGSDFLLNACQSQTTHA